MWNMLSVQHCMQLAFPSLPSPSILEAKLEDRVYNVVAFWLGTWLDRFAEERIMGRWDMVFATERRNDTSGVTK